MCVYFNLLLCVCLMCCLVCVTVQCICVGVFFMRVVVVVLRSFFVLQIVFEDFYCAMKHAEGNRSFIAQQKHT